VQKASQQIIHQKHRVEWTTPDEPTAWLAVFYRT
jgi:hypothetical protein